uniref:Uncharacterized protein n=1 Tax=Biddulphia biddulphiana TaxID=1158022 RepID=A0A2U9NSI6_9STRA|nr:hypothetical protein ycf88 [Biddulphia biddulphiana]AWT40094.1 hypothetical protein ycf88 [Biddulphia biddulphiana]
MKIKKLEKYSRIKKVIEYPDHHFQDVEIETHRCNFRTFYINYKRLLSFREKLILKSINDKYFYYALDDILYGLNLKERDNIVSILYSTAISLQNNLCVNFLDIWIDAIYIHELPKFNKFIKQNYQNLEFQTVIAITFLVKSSLPTKKIEIPW